MRGFSIFSRKFNYNSCLYIIGLEAYLKKEQEAEMIKSIRQQTRHGGHLFELICCLSGAGRPMMKAVSGRKSRVITCSAGVNVGAGSGLDFLGKQRSMAQGLETITYMGDPDGAPGLGLAQPWLLYTFEKRTTGWKIA